MNEVCVITIGVTNMQEAVLFYTEKLGFSVSKVYSEDIISLEHHGIPIILEKTKNNSQNEYQNHAQIVIAIKSNDLKASIVKLKDKGVELLYDTPQKCPPGYFTAIKDPSGNVIELIEFE